MNFSFYEKIWKDPVWSKVIAAGIIFICSAVIALIKENDFLNFPIKLKYVLLLFLFFLLIYIIKPFVYKSKSTYTDSSKEFDKSLLIKLKSEFLLDNGLISFLKEFDFQDIIDSDSIKKISKFRLLNENVDFEFIDTDLNQILLKLKEKFTLLSNSLSLNFFPIDIDSYRIPKQWRSDNTEKYKSIIIELTQLADEICDLNDKLIKCGKHKLAV